MLPVRVFFEKKDMARYISHLDLQRAVRRAVERSGLTVRQTEGFNPHPKMVFSMPLSMYPGEPLRVRRYGDGRRRL